MSMFRRQTESWLARWLAAAALLAAQALTAQVEFVDPTIGNVGILLEPTRPTVHLPNSMVRVYPIRADALDDQIKSFPLTIISHRLGELFSIMPGESSQPAAYDQEQTTPYYYSTRFDGSLIQTEFSPAERCGYFRFTFPSGQAGRTYSPTACPAIGPRPRVARSVARSGFMT